MRLCHWCAALCLATCSGVHASEPAVPAGDPQIAGLLQQLNDPRSSQRDQAEALLFQLAPTQDPAACEQFLQRLPQENLPPEVQLRLTRLRRRIQTENSQQALAASRLSWSGEPLGLQELLDKIHAQTGNRLRDYREQFGGQAPPQQISLALQDEPFWPGLDRILDQAQLSLYPYAGKGSLAVVQRAAGTVDRYQHASYVGAFRIAATQVVAERDLRQADAQTGQIELEIAWEPRLQPIAFTQSVDQLQLLTADQETIPLAAARQEFAVEVPPGSQATELRIPYVLPPRSVARIAVLRGQLSALVPGRVVEFQFANLGPAPLAPQQQGGMQVFVGVPRRNGALWELPLRLRVHGEETALESHRDWVFQNLTYLRDSEGQIIDHAGFETTQQTPREVGLIYFFELPADVKLSDCTWVYRTPAALVRWPLPFALRDIWLP